MNFTNYKSVSFGQLKNNKKKTFVINKLQKKTLIPNLKQKTNILFKDPDNYLKLPYETKFHFVVGKKPKGPRFNSNNKLIPYSVVGSFIKKETRKMTRKKSLITYNNTISRSTRKSMRLSKIMKFNPVTINEAPKEEKKKKRNYIENLTCTDIFDIFNKSKKRINKNLSENVVNKKKFDKEIPKTMHQYINEPLSQQEKALINNEKYNNILKKIEGNIFKSLQNKSKSKKNYNDTNIFENISSSNLMKNSCTKYRIKVEKNNLNDKKNNPNLVLNNHVQNWEMSLRRPKNFIGERREYLNIRTDENPYWIVLTEKNPSENEKIIIPHNTITNKWGNINNFYNTSYFKTFSKPLESISYENTCDDRNILKITGKKLIDIEEKLAKEMKGNIRMMDLKYDRESVKDIIFKANYCINGHSFDKK